MTNQPTTDQAPVIEPSPLIVESSSSDRLSQLHAMYAGVKAKADAAAAELKVVTDAIKLELTTLDPNARRFTLTGEDGPALALTYSTSWRLDSKKLKVDDPETYVRYAKQSGSWSLRPASNVGGEA